MAPPPAHLERSALRVSIAVIAALSVVGVAWGIAVGPQMILRLGPAHRVSSLAEQGPTTNFPYGDASQ